MIKFSVIVPIFRVEQYLNRCMESIVNQTYRNLEIIMVDDGSPDSCPALCEEWKRRDSRIQVIHKENGGLALARNSGLEIASGDYVSFVDSDDYLVTDLFSLAACELEKSKADICWFGHCMVDRDGKKRNAPMDYPDRVTEKDIRFELLPRTCGTGFTHAGSSYSLVPAWSGIYRRAFLDENNLRFQKIVSEDKLFNMQAFYHVKSVSFLAKPLYMYCENASSLTKVYRPYLFDAACDLYARQKKLVGQWGLQTILDQAVHASFLTHVHACLKQENRFVWDADTRKAKQKMKTICESTQTQAAIRQYPMETVELKKRIFYRCVQLRLVHAVRWILRMHDALETT